MKMRPLAVRLLLVAMVAAISFGAFALYVNSTQAGTVVKFTVNSSLDTVDVTPGDGACDTTAPGPPVVCTFRAAIMESNVLDGPNAINFTVSNTTLGGVLPTIVERLNVDASDIGFAINAAAAGGDGLTLGIGSTGSVIRGLEIFGTTAAFDGLVICGGAGQTIGGDPDEGAAPNGQGNTFRGNGGDGVDIQGAAGAGLVCGPSGSLGGHTLVGNKVGTAPDGLSVSGNGANGINVSGGIGDTITIGGFPNLISANAVDGVFLGGGSPSVTVQNNWFGLDSLGNATDPFANVGPGVHIHTDNNTVWNNIIAGGGVSLLAGNSAGPGIDLNGNGNTITGNCIGYDSRCSGNSGGFAGIGILCLPFGVTADNNVIGDGTEEGANVIGNLTGIGISFTTCNDNDLNRNVLGFGDDGEKAAPIAGDCVQLVTSSRNQVRNSNIGNCGAVGVHIFSGTGNVIGGAKVAAGEDNDGNTIGLGTDPSAADGISRFCVELNGTGAGNGGNAVRNNTVANCGQDFPDASIQITNGSGNTIQGNDITSPPGEGAVDVENVGASVAISNLIASRVFRMVDQSTGDLPIDIGDNGVTLNDAGDTDSAVTATFTVTCAAATAANECHNYPVFPPVSPTDGCARGSVGPFDDVRIYSKSTEGNVTTYEYLATGTANVAGDFTVCFNTTEKVTVVGTSTVTVFSTLDTVGLNSTSEFSVTEQTVQPGATATSTATASPTITETPTITPTPEDTAVPPTATDTPVPPTATDEPEPQLCGDVNMDGAVDSVDASLILQFKVELISTLANEANADVDDDGEISSIDAALILQATAELFPVGDLTCPPKS